MTEYIKRENVLAKIDEFVKLNEEHGFSVDAFDMAILSNVVIKIPAADVAPVVRGKWLNIDGDYTFASCSICSEDYEVATEEEAERGLWGAFLSAYRYCPNCGAKMDGSSNG